MISSSRLYRAVRQFAQSSPIWEPTRITYDTLPDERWDLTLVSQRVYGNRDEALTILAAAGLDRYDQEMTERTLVLPSIERLTAIKSQVGYVSQAPSPVR